MPHPTNVNGTSHDEALATSIPTVPVTEQRKPFVNTPSKGATISSSSPPLRDPGTARVNIAPSVQSPNGTTKNDWASRHSHQSVLQQHCDFFDTDHDGILWPSDTFSGFHRLGFNVLYCCLAVFLIHTIFSYPTSPSWIPDHRFRLHLKNIHKSMHGSDTGTYDMEGRYIPQKFEDIFAKYAEGRDYMTIYDLFSMLKGQRNAADIIGWGGATFEWISTYIMLWPEDGRMMKEDIRGVYDGSIFYTLAERRAAKR